MHEVLSLVFDFYKMRSRPDRVFLFPAAVFLLGLFLLPLSGQASGQKSRHVLLLHSYHPGMTWVRNIERAVYDVLNPSKNNIILHVEYLDSKRVHSSEYYHRFARVLKSKYANIDLDLIMVSDNNAFNLLVSRRKKLFSEIPMVFCGINDFRPEMLRGTEKITGVVESPSPADTLRVMLALKPDTKKIYVINDYLTTGRAWTRDMRQKLEPFRHRVDIEYNKNLMLKELRQKISSFKPGTMILLGAYYADRSGDYFTYEQVGTRITGISPVPVFCLLRFNLREGVVGGKVVEGYTQGKFMASMAERVLSGESTENIPVRHKGANRFVFDNRELDSYGMSKNMLPPGSVIINAPLSFYSQYKGLTWAAAVIAVILILFIALLMRAFHTRKKIEARLRKSEARYRSIFNNATEGIFQSTPEGFFIDVNPAMAEILGYAGRGDLLQGLRDIPGQVYEKSADRLELQKQLNRHGVLFGWEVRLNKKNGRSFWGALNIRRVEDPGGPFPVYYEGTLNDISRRKKDEWELRRKEAELRNQRDVLEDEVRKRTRELGRSEERLRTLFEASADAILTFREDVFVDCNPATLDLFGLADKKDILDSSPVQWSPEKQPDGSFSAEKKTEVIDLAVERGTHRFEWTMLRSDGTPLPLEIQLTALQADDGGYMFNAALRDLTEKKQAEEEIARANELMQNVLDAATQVSIIATDRNGLISVFNSGAERMLGYRAEEVVGRHTPEFFHLKSEIDVHAEELSQEYGEQIQGFEVFVARARRGGYDEREWTYVRRDGSHLTVNLAVTAIFDDDGGIKLMLGVAMDITRKKQFERELIEMEKLKSVGSLAGGIAHDFNNVLAGIFGNITLARQKLEDAHPALGSLDKVERAMHRASRLTGKLLTFARGGEPVRDSVCLREITQNVALDLVGSRTTPVFDFEEDLWTADVDKNQVEQVFFNLIMNAEQAMPEGGVVYISLQNADIRGQEIAFLSPGKYIRAAVRDEGSGIDSRHVNRVFDPYFSTREYGHGLGLAIVQSIVVHHGGVISVQSRRGKGTEFVFYLPAAVPGGENRRVSDVQKTEYSRTEKDTYRVLVMDDEEMIRDFTSELLQDEGYEVRTASKGEEAILLYREFLQAGTPFDAVLMDLTIPGGMGGKETVRRILEIDAEARCIVSSGYTSDSVLANYREYGFVGMLAKPHTAEELKEVLRRVISGV
jgi:PAS domain S-box-containing protein